MRTAPGISRGAWWALAVAGLGVSLWLGLRSREESQGSSSPPPPPEWPPATDWVSQRERLVANTVWAKEQLAQACAATIETWWDAVKRKTNGLEVAASFSVGEIVLGRWESPLPERHGLLIWPSAGPGARIPPGGWRGWLTRWIQQGWQLDTVEFRHRRFETDPAGIPRESWFEFSAHLARADPIDRAVLTGVVRIEWAATGAARQVPAVARIDASGLKVLTRSGESPFPLWNRFAWDPREGHPGIDPLLACDRDGDGRIELLLPAANRRCHVDANGAFTASPLFATDPGLVLAAVVADTDADGCADLVAAGRDGLRRFRGGADGSFADQAELIWAAPEPLANPMVLTAGDANGDGWVDLFLGQYRVPLLGQVLRPHYYNANDGHPAYLLWNDGHGRYRDATPGSGLEAKRARRIYAASWVDLDHDADLDLLVVADFAGIDLYRNDGQGHLVEVTQAWTEEAHGFGMAHVLADFNVDGWLDLLMIGMPSPTVDRLEYLNLARPDAREDRAMRARMAHGNRLHLGRGPGRFEQSALGTSIARSGWSWGAAGFDADNDGFPDVYIANGYQSRQRVRDYESEFWLHDLYVGDEADDVAATAYFLGKYQRTRGQGWSYGGHEKNRLFWNLEGRQFLEIGHLFGLAAEEDARCVVAQDFDADGRVDLAFTTEEVWPEVRHTLRIYRNRLAECGHWIGFRLPEGGLGRSPLGLQITVDAGGRRAVRSVVAGDSFRSQHAPVIHFGLGANERVERVEIRWPDGATRVWPDPPIDRYHLIAAPALASPRLDGGSSR